MVARIITWIVVIMGGASCWIPKGLHRINILHPVLNAPKVL